MAQAVKIFDCKQTSKLFVEILNEMSEERQRAFSRLVNDLFWERILSEEAMEYKVTTKDLKDLRNRV